MVLGVAIHESEKLQLKARVAITSPRVAIKTRKLQLES